MNETGGTITLSKAVPDGRGTTEVARVEPETDVLITEESSSVESTDCPDACAVSSCFRD